MIGSSRGHASATAAKSRTRPARGGGGTNLFDEGRCKDEAARRDADALGATHIVFGHEPSALGPVGEIAAARGGLLFRIDCGMSPDVNHSTGKILRVRAEGSSEVAESLDAQAKVVPLWRTP
jgi:hypothetical protein